MSESRNERIQEMLQDGEKLKDFYRFSAQNPYKTLHDACQIVLERPKATICFSYEEWEAMGRHVISGRKGIRFNGEDGISYVFDVSDTFGSKRYQRLIFPIKHLTEGLAYLNGEDPSDDASYNGIEKSVGKYLQSNGYLSEDEDRNRLICQGVSYSLYCKTGFPKSGNIHLNGLPYSVTENADLFKDIYHTAAILKQDIEDAYLMKISEVPVIDDTEEEVITDEPKVQEDKKIVKVQSAIRSQYKDYDVLAQYDQINYSGEKVYLGKRENYDNRGNYDNTDNSLIYVSDNPNMFHLLAGSSYVLSQKEMVEQGLFTEADYKEYSELCKRFDSQLEKIGTVTFSVDVDKGTKGVPFRYPYIEGNPIYVRYMTAQEQYPQAVVIMRLGDFYEVFGENAVKVSQELNLTLTGRDVGLAERIPMCGFPYHVTDKYLDKILENHSVVVVEDGEEPKYILSHAEAQGGTAVEEQPKRPKLVEYYGDEPSPFDTDESVDKDFSTNGTEADLSDDDEEIAEYEEYSDEIDDKPSEDEEKPKSKPQGKPLSQRKRKNKPKPQLSMFDIVEPKEQTEEEKLIEWGLKRGSSFESGKFRIYDKYREDPTEAEFADFLKKEYGIGGGGGYNGYQYSTNGKGYLLGWRDRDHPENNLDVSLTWKQVAVGIADLIDDDNYFTYNKNQ